MKRSIRIWHDEEGGDTLTYRHVVMVFPLSPSSFLPSSPPLALSPCLGVLSPGDFLPSTTESSQRRGR
jgi:hypothetical protein